MEVLMGLSADWHTKKLNSIAKINMGQSPPSSTYNKNGEGLPFFQGKKEFGNLYPKVEQWCNKPKKIAEKDDLLISVRAPVGDVNIANQKCCIGRGLAAIKFKGDLKFLFYFIQSNKQELEKQGTGSTFKAISGKVLKSFPIPYPPLPTQNRIVEKIEELFSELDNGVENLKKAQQQLKTYRQAVLKDAFEGKLTKEWREQQDDLPTPEELLRQIKAERKAYRQRELAKWEKEVEQWEKDGKVVQKPRKLSKTKEISKLTTENVGSLPNLPKHWAWIKLGEISTDVQIGPFGSLLHRSDYIENEIPVINPSNINGGKILPDFRITISRKKFEGLKKYRLNEGDVVVGRRGEMGRAAIVSDKESGWLCGTGSLVIRLTESYNSSFISKYIGSKLFKDYLNNNARGTTMKNLNATILLNSPFPLLSFTEQTHIVNEIESRLSVVDQLEQTIKENLQKAEALRQSILKKAFRGELVKEEVQEKKTDEIEEVTPFQQIQMIGVLVDILKEEYDLAFGEMALAKFLFLIDRIKKYQTGFRFKDWHWGPYDPDIKKRLTSKNGFFRRGKMSVIELNEKKEQLLKYHLPDQDKFEDGVNEVSRIIKKFHGKKRVGRQLELLATVCKVIENKGSAEFTEVIKGMKNWKVEKRTFKTKAEMFSEDEIQRCIEFVIKNNWEDKLISKSSN